MKHKLIFIAIILLAFFLRFWHLGLNPPSLDWDEASLGYNAYSILKTGRDEYGTFLPLSIRSFGDYKPPLYTYLTTIPVALFGLNEFSTRFISALFGAISILVAFFLIRELFPSKSSLFSFLFMLFFAISPWHIQFSRVAFEANLALFFFILGTFLFLKGLKEGKYYILSFLALGLSTYAYHSPRLIVPLFISGLIIIFQKQIAGNKKLLVLAASILIIFILPIAVQITSGGSARLGSVTIFNPENLGTTIQELKLDQQKGDWLGSLLHNRRVVYLFDTMGGYIDHFNFNFLFLNGDPPGRHHAAGMGMLYLWDLPFVIFGFLYLIKNRTPQTNAILLWFLLAPSASALTTGTPHAVRALFYIPIYQIFSTVAIAELLGRLNSPKKFMRPLIMLTFAFLILNFFYYLNMYWIHTPMEYSQWWQYGYKQLVEEVNKIENNYNKVIVTYRYDQPYIFFLFYNQINPSWYQRNWGGGEVQRAQRSFGKYEFRNIDWPHDSQMRNVILVGTPDEIPGSTSGLIKEIHFLDGSVAFRIVAR